MGASCAVWANALAAIKKATRNAKDSARIVSLATNLAPTTSETKAIGQIITMARNILEETGRAVISRVQPEAVEALRELVLKQAAARAKAGTAWKENNLVFCTSLGGPMYATDVRMEFKRITEKAGLGRDWTPRELRHTFVSLLSDSGVPIEQIADAVGHSSTRTTEVVYRHQLQPVTRTSAIALGPLFESRGKTNGGQS